MTVTALDKLKRTGFAWLERGIGDVVAARLAVAARSSQDHLINTAPNVGLEGLTSRELV